MIANNSQIRQTIALLSERSNNTINNLYSKFTTTGMLTENETEQLHESVKIAVFYNQLFTKYQGE